jgi:hypothetical protein
MCSVNDLNGAQRLNPSAGLRADYWDDWNGVRLLDPQLSRLGGLCTFLPLARNNSF